MVLPDVTAYTRKEQAQAADELEAHGRDMPMVAGRMMPDYGVMRKQARASKKILSK